MTSGNKSPPPFIESLVRGAGNGRRVVGNYRVVPDPDKWVTPDALLDILGLNKEHLPKHVLEVIDWQEDTVAEDWCSDWKDFKWALTAFNEMQDVFDSPLLPSHQSQLNLFHLWYFYFESRYLLGESLLSGFLGLYAASNVLLRLFVEFSVLQLYYYNVSHRSNSYARLEEYFKRGIHPSWNTALQKALPDESFARPIKSRLDFHFKGLSQSAVHSYHPTFSPRKHAEAPGMPSLEGIFFWQLTKIVLQGVLWGYCVNFPMLFRPLDVVRKFGFNWPVGVFVDAKVAKAIERGLGPKDYKRFLAFAQKHEHVQDLTEWWGSRVDLSDAEVTASWNAKENGELKRVWPEGYALAIAKLRVLRESMATTAPVFPDIDADRASMDIFSYERWAKIRWRPRR